MEKPREGDVLTFIPANILVTVVHVPKYHDAGDSNAVIIVQMLSGHTMPVPVSKLDKYLTEAPPKLNPAPAKPTKKSFFGRLKG